MRAVGVLAACVGRGHAQTQGAGELTIPFQLAAGRSSLLIEARIDHRAVTLIMDTGSSHTILRPPVAGVNPAELARPRTGAGVVGDAVGRLVTLEIGPRVWQRRLVSVMDLSAALAAYREKIDGVLGIDLLLEFSQTTIDFKNRRLILTT